MLRYSIFLFSLLILPARANLGDDVKQLIAHYGTPVTFSEPSPKNPFGTVVFQAAGFTLVVFLLNEKEVGARVSKTDKSAFTDAERQSIMSTDVAGSQWVATTSADPTCLQWSRSDKATVLYDQQKNMLIFTSDEMAKALQAAPAASPSPATNSAPVAPVTK